MLPIFWLLHQIYRISHKVEHIGVRVQELDHGTFAIEKEFPEIPFDLAPGFFLKPLKERMCRLAFHADFSKYGECDSKFLFRKEILDPRLVSVLEPGECSAEVIRGEC